MARGQSQFTNWWQYLLLRTGAMWMHMADVDTNLRRARFFGDIMYRLDKRHRERGIANIARCFPEMSDEQVADTCKRSMYHLLELGVEIMFTTRLMNETSWPYRVKLTNLTPGIRVMMSDTPSILVTGHVGNWEITGFWLATVGMDLDAIARPIDNPLVNEWLAGVRRRRGMRLIDKFGASETMPKVMAAEGMLGFIGDQNAGPRGLFVPFFGRLASAYKSIGLMAMRYNAPIICGYSHRMHGRFEYSIGVQDVIYPEDWEAQPDPLYYITARYTKAIEEMVRIAPEQYLWLHRRWKSRPRHELQGKPMPRALRAKLEALPWMTDELMNEVQKPA